MTRTRKSARDAGAQFERQVADYLAAALHDERIDRRVKRGRDDRGDISGLIHMGGRIVVECKDYGGQIKAAEWTREAEIERGNDDAVAGVVVAKRRGTTAPGEQWVVMTLADLVSILTGAREGVPF